MHKASTLIAHVVEMDNHKLSLRPCVRQRVLSVGNTTSTLAAEGCMAKVVYASSRNRIGVSIHSCDNRQCVAVAGCHRGRSRDRLQPQCVRCASNGVATGAVPTSSQARQFGGGWHSKRAATTNELSHASFIVVVLVLIWFGNTVSVTLPAVVVCA